MDKKKYLLIEIPIKLHKRLKIAAAERCITMRKYVLQSIIQKIHKDDEYK